MRMRSVAGEAASRTTTRHVITDHVAEDTTQNELQCTTLSGTFSANVQEAGKPASEGAVQ